MKAKEIAKKLAPYLMLIIFIIASIIYYHCESHPFPYTRVVRIWNILYSYISLLAVILLFSASLLINKKPGVRFISAKSTWLLFTLSAGVFILFNPWLKDNFPQLPFSVLLLSSFFCFACLLPRKISYILCPLLFLLTLIIYATKEMGIALEARILLQIFQTSWLDAMPYITLYNICLLTLAWVASVFVCFLGIKILKQYNKATLARTSLLYLFFFIVALSPTKQHIPFNQSTLWPFGCLEELSLQAGRAIQTIKRSDKMLKRLPKSREIGAEQSIVEKGDSVICVLHIGESLNALHLSFNGYPRNTTPWLSAQNTLINFSDCIASANMTNEAILTIMTNGRRNMFETDDPNYLPSSFGLMDFFSSCHYRCGIFWNKEELSPNSSSLMSQQVRYFGRLAHKHYGYSGDIFNQLPHIRDFITTEEGDNLFLLINNHGSHVFYEQRDEKTSPFPVKEPPGLAHSPETNAEHAEIFTNAYDSTVHYTDRFIGNIASILKGKPYIYFFIGDHGEYVGDNGYWKRVSAPANIFYKSNACRVPFFILYSPEFVNLKPHFRNAIEQLKKNQSVSTGHEHLFHTVLGVMGMTTSYYDASLDLSSPHVKPYAGPHPNRGGLELKPDNPNAKP